MNTKKLKLREWFKITSRIFLIAGIVSILVPFHIVAEEQWTRINLWGSTAQAAVSFDNKIFLSDIQGSTLYSEDGNWKKTYKEGHFQAGSIVYLDQIYGFSSFNENYELNDFLEIYRSDNGLDWTLHLQDENLGKIGDSIIFNNEIYAVRKDLKIMRFNGELDSEGKLAYSEISFPTLPSGTTVQNANLIEFKGNLHIIFRSDPSYELWLYRLEENGNWKFVGALPYSYFINEDWGTKLAGVWDNTLYVSEGFSLRSTSGDMDPYKWDTEEVHTRGGTPFIINKSLHYFHSTSWGWQQTELAKLKNGNWISMPLDLSWFYPPKYGNFYGETENIAVISSGYTGLLIMKAALRTIIPDNISDDQFYTGKKGASVLRFITEVNLHDRVTLTVKNKGTALRGQHIERVYITKREDPRRPSSTETFITELIADPTDHTNLRKWITAEPIEITDENVITVRIDIKEGPLDEASLLFYIETGGIQSEKDPSFSLEDELLSMQSSNEIQNSIVSAGPAPIPEVLIYPQPARDEVHFLYDLNSPAHVQIRIYNRSGVLVSELNNDHPAGGDQLESIWNSSQMGSGVYHAVIKIKPTLGSERQYKKMVFIKEK